MSLESWPTTTADAKAEQEALRTRVKLENYIDISEIKFVAGTDVAFKDNGKITRAVVAVLSFPEMELVEYAVEEQPTRFPYIPGYLSYREVPAIIDANAKLKTPVDVYMCDGQGIAHPRRFGLASHLGVLLNAPAIGVAKQRFIGGDVIPESVKGDAVALIDKDEQIGWVLRSRTDVKPVYVSPGHGVDMALALSIVKHCCVKYRLPEPTRIADKISKVKG